jgi:pimeloyl-ACP methyl ester carboxylesterase
MGVRVAAILLSLACVASAPLAQTPARTDPSPHRPQFVTVDDGVRLEVLDWGGTGHPLVFLSGIGDTAHVFDTFAPPFVPRYRVIGVTRRGFGASGRPTSGYTIPRLARDIDAVLDAMHLERPVLIGHSFAGEELSYIGAHEPNRVAGLVYVDAAYDHTRPDALVKLGVPPNLRPGPNDTTSRAAYEAFWQRTRGYRWPETELDQFEQYGDPPPSVPQAILAASLPPEYPKITAPALAIYVKPSSVRDLFPGYDDFDASVRPQLDAVWPKWAAAVEQDRQRFVREVPHGQTVALAAHSHYLFLSNVQEVTALITTFLEQRAWH